MIVTFPGNFGKKSKFVGLLSNSGIDWYASTPHMQNTFRVRYLGLRIIVKKRLLPKY